MQFAKEKYSIVLKDSSLEVVDFSVENKQELVNDVSPNPLKNPYFGDNLFSSWDMDRYICNGATPQYIFIIAYINHISTT